jgi:3'(2'), 5'-bisphosphate nucleotidase
MRHYRAGPVQAQFKADNSPVTAADRETEAFILTALAQAFPGVPVVAEEEAAAGRAGRAAPRFFLVDPLDGTREFLSRNGEFTVNIAEVVDGVATAGVVYAPACGRLFFADAGGAHEMAQAPDAPFDPAAARAIAARMPPATGLIAVGSRSHDDARTRQFLENYPVTSLIPAGSSLKFCLVAAGEADIYARGGPTMEWDTAAGHAVLCTAGGSVKDWEGTALRYGKQGFANPAFVARGKM